MSAVNISLNFTHEFMNKRDVINIYYGKPKTTIINNLSFAIPKMHFISFKKQIDLTAIFPLPRTLPIHFIPLQEQI